MPPRVFTTVSERLREYAEASFNHFRNRGYKVLIEKHELGFPYTPTLLCKRQNTTIIIEVFDNVMMDRVNDWIGYARSCNKDTRVAICHPSYVAVSVEAETGLRGKGVGLYVIDNNGVNERVPPKDLALNVELPSLNSLSTRLKRLLGPSYEQFDRSQWREGFGDVCQVFENEARRYLKAGIKSGRITVMRRSGPRNLTPRQVDKMTMGTLSEAFSNIQNQNRLDAQIGQVLTKINVDRVGVVHHKSKLKTESRLRKYVGQHVWMIVDVMKTMP